MAEYMQLQRRGLPSTAKLRGSPGATMLEIVAVLVIIGLLAAVAFSDIDTNPYNVAAETNEFKASLRFAQSLAFTQAYLPAGTEETTWGLLVTAGGYSLIRGGAAQNDVNLPGNDSPTYTLPSGVTLTSGTISYNFRGMPSTAAGAALNSNTTFTVTAYNKSETVTVTQQTGYIP